ncbi:MAG: DUF4202 domain-containing protein [Acidimicrobiia bacterium]|nr:DUF4202 domain-containing protein [Acidimicrobiia bacterium]
MDRARFERSVAAIDAANAGDPYGKELRDAALATEWVQRLQPDAGEELLLAARAHHLRRWTIPRSSYPDGRNGYLRWRRELQKQHAADVARILASEGYDDATIERVCEIIQKRRLTSDPEVQTFEDALCLVFLETQLGEFAERHADKADDVLAKTLDKMSDEGRALAAGLLEGKAAG